MKEPASTALAKPLLRFWSMVKELMVMVEAVMGKRW
jgi:hypothetical protein